ncbi:LLM class flavin-dependent oxidoreductase [Microbacterium rhizosphaerae]|uniref:LLM class flavin-dependent oxidoreductase n=1 Tax=Microbacterium rhizosphaerae TaxID=1678237 RepID=A0ABZ0SL26_9MICO|nr:LLM class flavin-dependent oxidoreductase [Microbacterium rhizosphaerae]WPR88986.1 LLM class flavin-dependent oxidoreductase [Microbacterium rhizosphaerae]
MQRFGTLSFGHYGPLGGGRELTARDSLHQAIDLAQGMDDLGVNGVYFRVHHFARQQSSPMTLLAAIAARTERIEMGTGVIDMRYENPLYLAEEAASVDLLSDGRLALGVSRGSPETVIRGYEAFGYTGSQDPRGADIAREHFATFLEAIEGAGLAERDSTSPFGAGARGMQRIEPHSPGLRSRIWWGAGNRDSAEWAGRIGVNLMSSTLLTEDRGIPFDELQAQQIDAFRAAWKDAGHPGEPRTSVSRSIFPITTAQDAMYFGRADSEGVGYIDGMRSTFGKTYAAEPDALVEQLLDDAAIRSADTLMLTIPSQLGVEYNLHIVESFAAHVAPALGWQSTRA